VSLSYPRQNPPRRPKRRKNPPAKTIYVIEGDNDFYESLESALSLEPSNVEIYEYKLVRVGRASTEIQWKETGVTK
jgi:hypothetical protein